VSNDCSGLTLSQSKQTLKVSLCYNQKLGEEDVRKRPRKQAAETANSRAV